MKSSRITYMRLSEIRPASRNAKTHDIGAIMRSIVRFGFVAPMVYDETKEALVAGHGRLEAVSKLKAADKPAPKHVHVDRAGEWHVPVLRGVSFDDDKEAEGYLLADNRLVELGGWDDEALGEMLRDLDAAEDELLASVGWNEEELRAVMAKADANLVDFGRPPLPTGGDRPGVVKDGHWFYVEYYEQPERFAKLRDRLGGRMKGAHEIDADAFEALLTPKG